MANHSRSILKALNDNVPFMEQFAAKYPQFYDHPFLDEKEGEEFMQTLRREYQAHPEIKDPMPYLNLNIIYPDFQTVQQKKCPVLQFPVR